MPDIAISDRLGVVVRDPFDGIGAVTFVLPCVTAFYDEYRVETDDFYAYPDYFTLQSDGRPVDYRWFDIWPDHKNIETTRGDEAVLRTINDRGINILLVPDRPPSPPDLDAVSRESFERRIDSCFLYAPDGQLDGPSFSIRQPRDPAWEWIQKTLDTIDDDYADLQVSGSTSGTIALRMVPSYKSFVRLISKTRSDASPMRGNLDSAPAWPFS